MSEQQPDNNSENQPEVPKGMQDGKLDAVIEKAIGNRVQDGSVSDPDEFLELANKTRSQYQSIHQRLGVVPISKGK